VVDSAAMTFPEQLKIIRHSNILAGVHGAGLTWNVSSTALNDGRNPPTGPDTQGLSKPREIPGP
jgi:hypothetical protein